MCDGRGFPPPRPGGGDIGLRFAQTPLDLRPSRRSSQVNLSPINTGLYDGLAVTPRVLPIGYARATVGGNYGPTTWENVLHFGVTPVGTPDPLAILDDIAAGAFALYENLDPSHFTNNWTTSTTKVKYRNADGSYDIATVADAIPGTDSDGGEAAQVSYLVELTTSDIRKGGKGRVYVNGVASAALADSANVDPTALGAMNAGLATWFAGCLAGTFGTNGTLLQPVVMSWITAGAVEDPGVPYAANSVHLSSVVATQRRRIDRLR